MKQLTRLFAALAAVSVTAAVSAAPISGTISSSGTICLGSTPAAELVACTVQDVSTLTYFDFITGGETSPAGLTPTPGLPGAIRINIAEGADLIPLIGKVGTINDFALPADLSTFAGVIPLWTVAAGGDTYTFALEDITTIDRSTPRELDVLGSGTLCRNAADCNLFSFIFTTQNAGNATVTSFSLSQSARVPEPGSLTLLGLGLVGLAFTARRRRPQ